jgi:hypothetical protein
MAKEKQGETDLKWSYIADLTKSYNELRERIKAIEDKMENKNG